MGILQTLFKHPSSIHSYVLCCVCLTLAELQAVGVLCVTESESGEKI